MPVKLKLVQGNRHFIYGARFSPSFFYDRCETIPGELRNKAIPIWVRLELDWLLFRYLPKASVEVFVFLKNRYLCGPISPSQRLFLASLKQTCLARLKSTILILYIFKLP